MSISRLLELALRAYVAVAVAAVLFILGYFVYAIAPVVTAVFQSTVCAI